MSKIKLDLKYSPKLHESQFTFNLFLDSDIYEIKFNGCLYPQRFSGRNGHRLIDSRSSPKYFNDKIMINGSKCWNKFWFMYFERHWKFDRIFIKLKEKKTSVLLKYILIYNFFSKIEHWFHRPKKEIYGMLVFYNATFLIGWINLRMPKITSICID